MAVTKHIRSIVDGIVTCYSNGNEVSLHTCRKCGDHAGDSYSGQAIKCTYPAHWRKTDDEAQRTQLDLFLDGAVQPTPIRVWFTLEVRLFVGKFPDYHPWCYGIRTKSKPSFPSGGGGPAMSKDAAMMHLEGSMKSVLRSLVRARSDSEVDACYREQAQFGQSMKRLDREIKYSVELNGVEIVPLRLYKPGEIILPDTGGVD